MNNNKLRTIKLFPKTKDSIFLIVGLLLLTGCVEKKPSEADFKAKLAPNLPEYIKIEDINIEAQENVGDSVEPRWKSRLTAKLSSTQILYKQTGKDALATFVSESQPKGHKVEVVFTSVSTLTSQGGWNVDLYPKYSEEYSALGKPFEYWDGFVVRSGNKNEESLYEDKKVKFLAEQEAKRKRNIEQRQETQVNLKDNKTATALLVGYWDEKCSNGTIGRASYFEDGIIRFSKQGEFGADIGKYEVKDGQIHIRWDNSRFTAKWDIHILTKDVLKVSYGNQVCEGWRDS